MNEFAKDALLPSMESSKILVHVFIVILFFENYLIHTVNESLFTMNLSLVEINLAPFVWFFIFLAFSRSLWWFFQIALTLIKGWSSLYDSGMHISHKMHTSLFSLTLLLSFYLLYSSKHFPVNKTQNPIFYNIFTFFICSVLTGSILALVISEVDFEVNNESSNSSLGASASGPR